MFALGSRSPKIARVALAFVFAGSLIASMLDSPLRAADALATPITKDNVDPDNFTEWVDGKERPLKAGGALAVLYTTQPAISHTGQKFGESQKPGIRHLRIGFNAPVAAGAIMVRGGGKVSVLKADAAYPGNLADDSQWISAERIKDAKLSSEEVGQSGYALWTLPRVVQTRAIRFTHDAQITDRTYEGYLGGAFVVPERVATLASQANVVVSANDRYAPRLLNEQTDPGWDQWANIDLKGERFAVVSAEDPEWVMLTWHVPVKVSGLGVFFAGFQEADAQIYTGSADVHPREAAESAWKTVKSFVGLKNRYPASFCADWLDFGAEYTTRAVRLKITKGLADGGHPHTTSHPKQGRRVWIGELVALTKLGGAKTESALLPVTKSEEKPPIAVKFTIPEPGFVTLVIEDSTGKRVRNLIADSFFEKAGENIAWWDGSDDLGRDKSAADHGLYLIPTQFVLPGNYRVRGLWRKKVEAKLEFGVYDAGRTPWETADRTGAWLSNHTPPSATLFVPNALGKGPSILIGSYVSEGTAGLAWVDLEGRKWKGQNWVGGTWTGAPFLARDAGTQAAAEIYGYVGAAWEAGTDPQTKKKKGEIRITGLTNGEDKPIAKVPFTPQHEEAEGKVDWEAEMGGVAVRDGLVAASLTRAGQVIFVDAKSRQATGSAAIEAPRGLAFDAEGQLLVISGSKLLRFSAEAVKQRQLMGGAVVCERLDEPSGITIDAQGNIYVSERGQSHQVKIFTAAGKPLRAIGKAGAPTAGAYDALHMNDPRGIAVDSTGRVWVAEENSQPKRVSVWLPEGKLASAFYGPAEYGGGGALDESDKSKFYYNGMEFRIDWEKGTDTLTSIYYRPGKDALKLPFRSGVPQATVHVGGRRYWTNSWNSNPTGGHGSVFIFADKKGVAVPVAGAGRANEWEILKAAEFASIWPAGTEAKSNVHSDKAAFFLWSDANDDGQAQPSEIQLQRGRSGGVSVGADLSFVFSRIGENSVRFAPKAIGNNGVPSYDIAAGQVLVPGAQNPPSSGGDQALVGPDGWTVHTNAPKPFSASGLGGAKNGVPMWSYPSLWPGLHASHNAPVPDRPGMVIGHTRLLGDFITPSKEAGPMWMLNGNTGCIYVFTYDGLFVAQLFNDMRLGRSWSMPVAERGTSLDQLTPSDENFWPGVTQTPDGKVYLVTGRPNCLARIDGLESTRRIAAFDLKVSAEDLNRAHDSFARAEAARQAAQGRGILTVAIRGNAPVVDGKLDDWSNADWADIDKRGTAAYFNSDAKPYDVRGAMAVSGDKLYAAWRTGDKGLLKNAGNVPNALFKTGGALDLMIATNAAADPKRDSPAQGDARLLITQVAGKTKALLYRAVAPGTREPVAFSSPWRTIHFDRVDDVSDAVQLGADGDGNFEIAVSLQTIGLKVADGQAARGDIGILRGDGAVTTQRVYWSNKATAIVADVPSEAELRPGLWGKLEFKAQK